MVIPKACHGLCYMLRIIAVCGGEEYLSGIHTGQEKFVSSMRWRRIFVRVTHRARIICQRYVVEKNICQGYTPGKNNLSALCRGEEYLSGMRTGQE